MSADVTFYPGPTSAAWADVRTVLAIAGLTDTEIEQQLAYWSTTCTVEAHRLSRTVLVVPPAVDKPCPGCLVEANAGGVTR